MRRMAVSLGDDTTSAAYGGGDGLRRDATRAKRIPRIADVAGTSLDQGEELDALARRIIALSAWRLAGAAMMPAVVASGSRTARSKSSSGMKAGRYGVRGGSISCSIRSISRSRLARDTEPRTDPGRPARRALRCGI